MNTTPHNWTLHAELQQIEARLAGDALDAARASGRYAAPEEAKGAALSRSYARAQAAEARRRAGEADGGRQRLLF